MSRFNDWVHTMKAEGPTLAGGYGQLLIWLFREQWPDCGMAPFHSEGPLCILNAALVHELVINTLKCTQCNVNRMYTYIFELCWKFVRTVLVDKRLKLRQKDKRNTWVHRTCPQRSLVCEGKWHFPFWFHSGPLWASQLWNQDSVLFRWLGIHGQTRADEGILSSLKHPWTPASAWITPNSVQTQAGRGHRRSGVTLPAIAIVGTVLVLLS